MDKDQLHLMIIHKAASNAVVTRNLISQIEDWVCDAEWTTNSEAALAAMAHNQHDVYLVDHHPGNWNGIELATKAIERGCQSPIILLLDQKDYEIESKIAHFGLVDYLIKSHLSPLLLEHTIRHMLKHAKTQQALQASEERHFYLTELSLNGIAIHSAGQLIFVNPAGANLLGADNPKQLIGKPILDFIHPDYRNIVQARVQTMIKEKQPAEPIEEKFMRLDGQSIDVEVTAIPITYRGKPAVQVLFKDITDRKVVDIERELLLSAEREQRKFSEALHNIAIALNSTLNLDDLLERILTNVEQVVPHDTADIMLVESGMIRVAGNRGYEERGQPPVLGMSFHLVDFPVLQKMVETKEPLVIPDTGTHLDWVKVPETNWVHSYVGAPIWNEDQVIGLLNVNSSVSDFYNDTHTQHLQAFAHLSSIAIENARLLEAERKRRELAESLREASAALNATLEVDIVFDRLLDQIARVVPYDTANVMLLDGDQTHTILGRGYEQFGENVAQNIINVSLNTNTTANLRQLIKTQQAYVISDTAADSTWIKVDVSAFVRSWIGAPIMVKGQVAAFFSLDKKEPGFYQPEHAELLTLFASQTSLALENARLFDAEARRRHEAETLHKATTALTSALDLGEVLDNILIQLEKVVPYDSASIFLYQTYRLHAVAGRGLAEPTQVIGQNYQADEELFQELLRNHQPICLTDAQKDPRFKNWENTAQIHGWMGIPLIVRQNFIGYLTLGNQQVAAYGQVEMALGQTFANQAAIAITNAQLFEQTQTALAQTEALYQIARTMITLDSLSDMLQSLVDRVAEMLLANRVSLIVLNLQAKQVTHFVTGGPGKDQIVRVSFEKLWDGLTGWTLRKLEPALSPKGKADPRESTDVQLHRTETDCGAIIVAPLHYRNNVFGTITAINRLNEPDFTQQDVDLMMAIANQAAIALENTRLFDITHRRAQQLAILNELSGEMTGLLDVRELCITVAQRIHSVFDYYNVAIFTFDSVSQRLVIQINTGAFAGIIQPGIYQQSIGQGIIGRAAETGEIIVVNDTRQDPDFFQLDGMNILSELAIPLKVDQQLIGVLNVDCDQVDSFDESDIAALMTVADQLAVALEKARLFAETRQRADQLEALRQISQDLTLLQNLEALLQQITKQAMQLLGGDSGGLHLYQPEEDILESMALFGDDLPPSTDGLKPGEGLVGKVWVTNKALIINDYQGWSNKLPNWPENIPNAAIGVPIQWGIESLGVLAVSVHNPQRQFKTEDATLLSQFADQAAVAIENARLFEAEQAAREQAEALREETRQNLAQLTRLYELSTDFVSTLSLEEVANLVIEKVVLATKAHSAVLNLLNDGGHLDQTFGSNEPNPRHSGTTMTICKTGQPLIINDVQQESEVIQPHLLEIGIKASIGLPLKTGEQAIGALFVRYSKPHQFSQQEVETLYIFANQAAIAVQNAQLYGRVQHYTEKLEARVKERTFKLQALYELTHALGHATQLGDVIRMTLSQLDQTVPYAVLASLLITDTTNTLVFQSQHILSPEIEAQIQKQLLETLSQMRSMVIDETTLKVHRIHPKSETELKPELKTMGSMMTVPILIDETIIGLLLVATEEFAQFDDEHVRLLHIVANQAAETIGRLQSLLAAEHQRLENLVAHLPTGVIELDSEQHIVLTNQAARRMIPFLNTAQSGDKVVRLGEYTIEMILNHPLTEPPLIAEIDGIPTLTCEIMAQPITTGPEVGGVILVIRDITEEQSIQRRIQQQERMAAVGQLAAGIAHDFNNILTSIIGYAELLLLNPDFSPTIKSDLERITKQGHRAAHLVRQILDFSRQSITEKQSLDLVSFIEETIKLLERTIPEDINIILEVGPDDYTIKADLTQMQQALTNLAVNARDAMPDGGDLRFRLSRQNLIVNDEPPLPDMTPGTWIVLTISDTGIGILPEFQGQIYEPFFTTKEVGKGTGLGLAQVYGIIKEHEGYIDVTSEVGFGTVFTLYVPAPSVAQSTLPQTTPIDIPLGNNEVILLVEDDPSVLNIGTSMLQHLGYQVLTATNGFKALDIYEKHQNEIALVLTDLTMPKMGGVELTFALGKRNPAVKVVALTGYPLDPDAKEVLAQGIIDWLQKPLSIKELAIAVNRSLNLEMKIS